MKRVLLSVVMVVSACRAPSSLPKESPFDFDAHAGPSPDAFNKAADLLAQWNDEGSLRTFWNSGERGEFAGVDGKRVEWRIHRVPNAKAAVLVLPGRTEAIIKFAEVVRDLTKQGYSTYALTLRGQGEAERMLDDPDKGYVAWFDDYVQDTHRFVREHVKPEGLPVFVLSHSTGGPVAVLTDDQYPDDFERLVLNSPMLEIDLGSYPAPVAATLASGVCDTGDGTGYILGGGGYTREPTVDTSTVTHSPERHAWKLSQLDDDPAIRMGAPTWRWLCQALVGSSRAAGLGAYSGKPTLVIQAAEDSIVKPGGQTQYCADAPRCTLDRIEGARHEILQERDAQRNLAMSHIVKFFDAEVTP